MGKIKKENYYDWCLRSLLNKTIKHMHLQKIYYTEVRDKTKPKWAGKCLITENLSEIIYNVNCETKANKSIIKPFVLIHELGHYYNDKFKGESRKGLIKDDNLEKNADAFIYDFCRKELNIFELYVLQNHIEIFSKVEFELTQPEMARAIDLYDVYYKGVIHEREKAFEEEGPRKNTQHLTAKAV